MCFHGKDNKVPSSNDEAGNDMEATDVSIVMRHRYRDVPTFGEDVKRRC